MQGKKAYDEKSKSHDDMIRKISKEVAHEMMEKYPLLERKHKLPKEYFLDGIGACQPDGGIWFYDGHLIASFEGKKQNDGGNAIERWFKNYDHIRTTNPRCPLVTYAIGSGVRPNNPIWKTLYRPHKGKYNIFHNLGPSCFLNEGGFSRNWLKQNMIDYLEMEIETLTKEII